MPEIRWLDTHIHVSDVDRNGRQRSDILPDLLDVLERESADLRFVISGDFPWPARMMQSPEQILAGNRFIHDLCSRTPKRLYGACTVNPKYLDESLAAMEVCFGQWGFVMLGEMLQYIMKYYMNSPATERLVREAVRYGVPVQVHISTSNSGPQGQFEGGGTEQLEDMMDLMERVPEASYILAHFVGMHDDNPPVVAGYLDQIERRFGEYPRNAWAEIRDFSSPGVKTALARIPHDRLIAGTDWVTRVGPPFLAYGTLFGVSEQDGNPYPPCVTSMVRYLEDAGLDADTIADIAFNNAAELLGLG